jgi:hypothetical protein
MAGVTKANAKEIVAVEQPPQLPANAAEGNQPAAAPKAHTARKMMPKAKAIKPKSAPLSPASDKKTPKKEKQKKIKMVRDSFTMPEYDYAKIAELKKKCLKAGVPIKKSELLRAGLSYLTKLSSPALLKTVQQVEKIKTGRPARYR